MRGWIGIAVLMAVGCGSDDESGSGFGGGYRVTEVHQDDTCNGDGIVVETEPQLAYLELADDGDTAIVWRTCSSESTCDGTGEPVPPFPRRFDEETADGWRGWLDATDDAGMLCNYFFYVITLERSPTDEEPDRVAIAERELRDVRTMDSCERPDDVTVDSAPCLEQRIFVAVPR
jgi:hypothetical protein